MAGEWSTVAMPIRATLHGTERMAPTAITGTEVTGLPPTTALTGRPRPITVTGLAAATTRVAPTLTRGAAEPLTRATVRTAPYTPGAAVTTPRPARPTTTGLPVRDMAAPPITAAR